MLLAGRPWLTLERHLVDDRLGRGRRARTRLRRQGDLQTVTRRPLGQDPALQPKAQGIRRGDAGNALDG